MTLQTSTRNLNDVVIVDCQGRIVLGEETAALRHLVKDLMGESHRIVLNLAGVNHIDSNGIGMLFGLYVSAGKAGTLIKLAGLGEHVKSVAEMTRLSTIYEVYRTADEAAASFAPETPVAKAG